jgi:hypothetical protein
MRAVKLLLDLSPLQALVHGTVIGSSLCAKLEYSSQHWEVVTRAIHALNGSTNSISLSSD